MLRKLNCFLNIVIGSSIGVFIGFGIYKFWHFKTYPNLYAIQSAPWYTELLLDGALVAVVVVVCIILKLIIRKKSKPYLPIEQNRCAMACQGYGAVFLYTLIKKQWKPSPTSSILQTGIVTPK